MHNNNNATQVQTQATGSPHALLTTAAGSCVMAATNVSGSGPVVRRNQHDFVKPHDCTSRSGNGRRPVACIMMIKHCATMLPSAVQQYMYSLVCPMMLATHACARLLMELVAVGKTSLAPKLALLLSLSRLILLTLAAEQHKTRMKGQRATARAQQDACIACKQAVLQGLSIWHTGLVEGQLTRGGVSTGWRQILRGLCSRTQKSTSNGWPIKLTRAAYWICSLT